MKKFYTPKEVSEILKVSSRTLSNKRALGNGPPFFKESGIVRYPADALEKYVNKFIHHKENV